MESDHFLQEIERTQRSQRYSYPNTNKNNPFTQEVVRFSTFQPHINDEYTSSSSLSEDILIQGFNNSAKVSIGIGVKEDSDVDGYQLVMENCSMSLSCTVPPKAGTRWFASFNGESVFVRQRGFASTQICIGYRIIDGLAILYDWRTQDGTSSVSSTIDFL